jgi:hypothetical protein
MKQFLTTHLDTIGFSTSLLCAIHCTAIPILLTVSTWSGLQLLNDPSIEILVLCLSTGIALASILPSYLRVHRKLNAIVLATFGFILIGLSRIEVQKVWEILLTSIGASLVASAHIMNWKLCQNCTVHHVNKE